MAFAAPIVGAPGAVAAAVVVIEFEEEEAEEFPTELVATTVKR